MVKLRFGEVAPSQNRPKEVTQMVTNKKKHIEKTPAKQGPEEIGCGTNKINGSTP